MKHNMQANFENNKTAMRQMQIEIAMKNRQMMIATQSAMMRQRLHYLEIFMGLGFIAALGASLKKHDPKPLVALFPFTVAWCFLYDMAYGNL